MFKGKLKAKSSSKVALTLIVTIGLVPQYAIALSCAQPNLNMRAQHTIDNPQTSAIIRGTLRLPEQHYIYNRDKNFAAPSTRLSYGTIDGYLANVNGFSTAISAKVEFKESCHRWPNTNICDKSDNFTSSVQDNSAIYFLGVNDIGYILTSSDCSMNSMQENPETVKEIASCFINGGC